MCDGQAERQPRHKNARGHFVAFAQFAVGDLDQADNAAVDIVPGDVTHNKRTEQSSCSSESQRMLTKSRTEARGGEQRAPLHMHTRVTFRVELSSTGMGLSARAPAGGRIL